MSWIERLTAEQIAQFPEFVERWTKIGLCTEPADRPRAEAAIREMYRQGGLEPPAAIVWCGSPLSQGLSRAIIRDPKLMPAVRDSVGDSVWANVTDTLRGSAEDSVGESAWGSFGYGVRGTVWDSVGESIEESLGDCVWGSLRYDCGSFNYSVRDWVRAPVWHSVKHSAIRRSSAPPAGYHIRLRLTPPPAV
jgi:hypothetical protein